MSMIRIINSLRDSGPFQFFVATIILGMNLFRRLKALYSRILRDNLSP